jgi:FkbM family methyltransferase
MFNSFTWTKTGRQRVAILEKYEPLQPFFFSELSKLIGAATFIDIGANIGAYSIAMASLDCIKSVHAFEPTPVTVDELKANIGLNPHASKITVHPVALSDAAKAVNFGVVSDFSGANSIIDTSIHPQEKFSDRLTIRCVPLDDIVSVRDEVLAMKIDVEGHELQAIAGSRNLLGQNRVLIQVENHSTGDVRLADFLSELGYRLLLNIGPDHYFSNIPELGETQVISAFSRASSSMIRSNLSRGGILDKRSIWIRSRIGVSIELSGTAARLARRLKRSLQRS